ncbi:MAG: hypothetical protein ITG02_00170, partial [Patulibacter sp.]|nr:hypothetical protein [Patulibacter sp.]
SPPGGNLLLRSPGPRGASAVPRARIASTALTLQRRRSGRALGTLRIRCAGAPCVGTVTVQQVRRSAKGPRRTVRTAARAALRLRSGTTGRVRVGLSRSRAAALRRAAGDRLRVTVRLDGEVAHRRTVRVRWRR